MKNSEFPRLRMPAEWEPHSGTWLAWPHRRSDWPGKFAAIPFIYAEIVRVLASSETVHLVVSSEGQQAQVKALLGALPIDPRSIRYHMWPTDRSWLRDSAAIYVTGDDGEKIALDWHFNAWAKYKNWKNDDVLPSRMAKVSKVRRIQPMLGSHRVVLEGGSIEVNGSGCLLTTEECLLSDVQARNPTMTRTDYESVFRQYLGIDQTLWLNKGIEGDDTHGHIDDLARFVDERTIAVVVEKNPKSPNYKPLRENVERLQGMTDARGRKFQIVELPMPAPISFDGQVLPASYANFYIANSVVIVPTFHDPQDRIVLGTLAELFPNRQVIGINCSDLILGLGTLHCMSQQEPL